MRLIAFSGGKDSTALALISPDAIPIFTDTGWEFNDVYEHLERFEQITNRSVTYIARAGETLPEYIASSKFMPGHAARFCTRMFKIEPYNTYIEMLLKQGFGPVELLIGLRADEPETERIGNLTTMPGLTIRYPLREMGLGLVDVLRICLEHNLLPRRAAYEARGGCKGCFYKRKSEVQAMAALAPQELDQLQALEESVQDERGKFALMFPNTGMSIRQLRQQQWLFNPTEVYAAASDKSDVGQACGLFCNR